MHIFLTVLSVVGFIALTLGTAVFVGAEFSLTTLERSTVEAHARRGDLRARMLRRAHHTLSFQLSGAQLGITITTLVTGYIAEPVLDDFIDPVLDELGLNDRIADPLALAIALVVATSLSMVYGELVPKGIAIARPLATGLLTAGPQTVFSETTKWAILLLNGMANSIVRAFGVAPAEELRSARSPQELGSLVRMSARRGSLDARTAQLVDRSLQFGERSAEELMTPRAKIESLETTQTVADLVAAARRTGFSRFPVVDGDLDNAVGIVHVKEVFAYRTTQARHDVRLSAVTRPVAVVPATLGGDEVLELVRADGMQVALVVDEYGGTAGMVTMEDLLEEIVGDVRDEHDEPDLDVQPAGDGWICSGLLRIDEVYRATGYRAPEGEYETIGGLVMTELGRIPETGDQLSLPVTDTGIEDFEDDELAPVRWQATVQRMDGRRVDRLLIAPMQPPVTPADRIRTRS